MKQFGVSKLLLAVGLGLILLSPMTAAAQGRPDARSMTCAQARSLVLQQGAAVLTTGQHTYDRYVAHQRFCSPGYITERAFVQTRDAQTCSIGYTCVLDNEWDDDRRWWLQRRR